MISILIPLYNEAENARRYPERLFPIADEIIKRHGEACEYILVNDGSSDATETELDKLAATQKNVVVISYQVNKGMGGAIRTGLSHCSGQIVIMLDSDLTYRPEDIEKLLAAYERLGSDCISASPYREKDLAKEIASPFRLYISKSVNFLYRILLQEDLTCMSAIFRLYRKSALDELTLESNNFEICAEILAKIILNKKSVYEIGVRVYTREYGESKLNVKKEIRNNLRILFKIFKAKYLRKRWQ
ncbi:glycosyltransferase family 2 protein [Methanoregula sp.]|uniref:glycosyltransferase family 2 protein n=1 Tax=Methanoregula sp. TaxID=2052170 RepID=UPI002BCDDF81|nr:glycosyltransferase family 2 protein [Methanoregula sp.]HVP95682.1 glycosyltransferase family 2 protein [Methanoregula sp.]